MKLERFIQDKEIADAGEKVMAILATAKDFGIEKPETFSFVVKLLTLELFRAITTKKEIAHNQEQETNMYVYGMVENMLGKIVEISTDKKTEIFMVEYMNSNMDTLLDTALAKMNTINPDQNLTIN